MASRNDLVYDWNQSPRLIRVLSPSTELTIQDLHDTSRDREDEPGAMNYPAIIKSAGKEDLGGSVTVGITSTLQDARVLFEARRVSVSSGTVTTLGTTSLIDSGADFVTDGVQPGAWVVNLTDGSVCSVVRVVSATELLTDGLGDGTDNTFAVSDSYKVWNVIQCEVSGGNLVAVDGVGAPLDAILPTAGTQVVRTSSASATLQELADIQYSSFSGGVTLDVTSSYSGTEYPTGTPRQPVNNTADAVAICTARGFSTIYVIGNLTIGAGIDFSGMAIIGESINKSSITIDAAANVTGAEVSECTVSGTLDGNARLDHCQINALAYVEGVAQHCILQGPITLGGGATAHFLDCWSGVPGMSTPVIDMGGSGQSLALRAYSGGIELQNKTGPENVSVDLIAGQVILAATVTAGDLVIRGVGKLTDNSAGATVANELLNTTTIETALREAVVDGTITLEQSLRLSNAILGGKVSGAGSGTETFRDPGDTTDRVISTVDSQGNRTAITRNLG